MLVGKEQRGLEGDAERWGGGGGGELVAPEICPWRGSGASVGVKQPHTSVIAKLAPLPYCCERLLCSTG